MEKKAVNFKSQQTRNSRDDSKVIHDFISILNIAPSWILLFSNLLLFCVFVFLIIARISVLLTEQKIIQL